MTANSQQDHDSDEYNSNDDMHTSSEMFHYDSSNDEDDDVLGDEENESQSQPLNCQAVAVNTLTMEQAFNTMMSMLNSRGILWEEYVLSTFLPPDSATVMPTNHCTCKCTCGSRTDYCSNSSAPTTRHRYKFL